MEDNKRTLKINPELFNLKKKKKNKTEKRQVEKNYDEYNSNKIKKELLKKVKDYHSNENKNLDKVIENDNNKNDFEEEFSKSLNFLQNLAKKKKDKQKRNKTNKINEKDIQINIDIPNIENNNSNYGCLKNGIKPTFRQLNKTVKNNKIQFSLNNNKFFNNNIDIDDNTNDYQDNYSDNYQTNNIINIKDENIEDNNINIEVLDNNSSNKLENYNNKNKIDIKEETNDLFENNLINNDIIKENTLKDFKNTEKKLTSEILSKIETDDESFSDKIPKKTKITRTLKYNLGKKNNKISLLLKNNKTKKLIKNEIFRVKNSPINEIKFELKKKNLIKNGSDAPNDILRKIYEDSLMAGDIINTNGNNRIYNYLH